MYQSEVPFSLAQRRKNILDLKNLALRLQDREVPGVELWHLLVADAVGRYQQYDLSSVNPCDLIVQDLAIVILGPAALKYLVWFEKITPDAVEDPLVKQFFTDFAALDLPSIAEPFSPDWRQHGYAGKIDDRVDPGLDRAFAADFRPELNDDTDNQIFHTFFYQFMAYITQAEQTIRMASLYHEVFDKGGSNEDHTAALIAIQTGQLWRKHRDSKDKKIGFWPDLIQIAYGKEVVSDPEKTLDPELFAFYTQIENLIEHPSPLEALRRSAEYGLIKLANAFSKEQP